MNLVGLLFLLITQFVCGAALVSFFNITEKTVIRIALANLCGVAIFSFLPFLLELVHVPIEANSLAIFIGVLSLLSLARLIVAKEWTTMSFNLKLPQIYEVPYLLFFGFFIFISVWRCFYYAPNARDMLSGPEAIAEFAIREHKIINSVFSVDLHTTNNQL
ncbi:MAG: hypothetical protein EBZ77_14685, partial [Chitinophagia bacterium]|nr:hypothetical protein [Chitinophagia bacterium]